MSDSMEGGRHDSSVNPPLGVHKMPTHRGIREALAIAAADTPLAGAVAHSSAIVHEGDVFSLLADVCIV